MACKSCGKKKVSTLSNVTYVVQDASGSLLSEFGNKASAAVYATKNPGSTVSRVVPGSNTAQEQKTTKKTKSK